MEFILYVITVGVMLIIYLAGYRKLHRQIKQNGRLIMKHHTLELSVIDDVMTAIKNLGKETQEIKTRLSWVKKRQLGKAKNS